MLYQYALQPYLTFLIFATTSKGDILSKYSDRHLRYLIPATMWNGFDFTSYHEDDGTNAVRHRNLSGLYVDGGYSKACVPLDMLEIFSAPEPPNNGQTNAGPPVPHAANTSNGVDAPNPSTKPATKKRSKWVKSTCKSILTVVFVEAADMERLSGKLLVDTYSKRSKTLKEKVLLTSFQTLSSFVP
jgi:hypothetical protein